MKAEEMLELERRFTYHAPSCDAEIEFYEKWRNILRTAAMTLTTWLPDCRERSLAIKSLEEAVMWGNAGAARRGVNQKEEADAPS